MLGTAAYSPIDLMRGVKSATVHIQNTLWYAAKGSEAEGDCLLQVHLHNGMGRQVEVAKWEGRQVVSLRPLVGDGALLYAATYSGEGRQVLLALHPLTGEKVWEMAFAGHGLGHVVMRDGVLTFAVGGRELVRFAPESRKVVWREQLPAMHHLTRFRVPLVTDTHIIAVQSLGGFMSKQQVLMAYSLDEAQHPTWQQSVSKKIGQPVADANNVYVTVGETLMAFGLRNGEPRWSYSVDSTPRAKTIPVVATDGQVLIGVKVGRGDAAQIALDLVQDGEHVGRFEMSAEFARDVPPLVVDEHVIVGDKQGRLTVLSLPDLEEVWSADLPTPISAPPTVVHDLLYVPTQGGKLHVLRWREQVWPTESADVLRERGDYEQAAVAYLIADEPNWVAAADCVLELEDAETGLRLVEAGILQGAALYGQKARLLVRQDQHALAIEAAEAAQDRHVLADVLAAVGRHGDSAEIYAELKAYQLAAEQYEAAKKPLMALSMYEALGDEESAERILKTLPRKRILNFPPEKQIRWLLSNGYRSPAADLLEQLWRERGDVAKLRQAVELRVKQRQYGRAGELYLQLKQPLQAAEMMQKQAELETNVEERFSAFVAAGDAFRAIKAWQRAQQCYARADAKIREAEMMAEQGLLVEAAELMQTEGHRQALALAGDYFELAARMTAYQYPAERRDNKRDPAIADLYQRAMDAYRLAGEVIKERESLKQIDYWLLRPRLEPVQVHLQEPLETNAYSELRFEVRNVGYAAALEATLEIHGTAQPERGHFEPFALRPNQSKQISVDIRPKQYAKSGEKLAFKLIFYCKTPHTNEVIQGITYEFRAQVERDVMGMAHNVQSVVYEIYQSGSNKGDRVEISRRGSLTTDAERKLLIAES